MQDHSPQPMQSELGHALLLRLFLAAFFLILLIKIYLATVLDLYSDEVFYWQASTNPAIAYSDLPFMTALLIGAGSWFEPNSALAARSLFLTLGACLPLLVYWLAKPLSDSKQALEAALLTLCLPLGGFLGLLAVPDVPLLFFGLLSIGFFERALRLDDTKYWIATGIAVALGLSTHYRFFLYPAAAVLFLIFFTPEQRQWKNKNFWIAVLISSLGLIPIIWFNLNNQLSSASFYFVDRHPWQFQASGLLHVFKQAALVTPFLYGLFICTLFRLWVKAKQGKRGPALIFSFSVLNLSVYMLLAPWTDASSTSIHWPLSAYFPLLAYTPLMLRDSYQFLSSKWDVQAARYFVITAPVIGFIGTLAAIIGVGSQAFQTPLQEVLGPGVLSNKMAGWKEFTEYTKKLIDTEFVDNDPLLISDNYYTLAQLEFANISNNGLTLDQDKAVRDGRITQYQIWNKDEQGLSSNLGRAALFISEDSTLSVLDKHQVLERFCHHIDSIEYLGELSLFQGDKKFSFYKTEKLIDSSASADYRHSPCPFPARAWIDQPGNGSLLTSLTTISGWAFNQDIGINQVYLLLDGTRVSEMIYGENRADVVSAMEVTSDPNIPALGYSYSLDTSLFPNGKHLLAIEVINELSVSLIYGERTVVIEN